MIMKHDEGCPRCEASLRVKVEADSDHRISRRWLYCEKCSWDQRHTLAPPSQERA